MKTMTKETYEKRTYEAAEFFNSGEYRTALKMFLELEEANPKNRKVHEVLVFIYLKLEEFTKAQRQYDILLKLMRDDNPSFSFELKSFDEVVAEAGSFEDARSAYDEIIRQETVQDPFADSQAAVKLALHYMAQKDFSKAEDIVTEFRDRFFPATA